MIEKIREAYREFINHRFADDMFDSFRAGYETAVQKMRDMSAAQVRAEGPMDTGCFEQSEANLADQQSARSPLVTITVSELGRLRTSEIKYHELMDRANVMEKEVAHSFGRNKHLEESITRLKLQIDRLLDTAAKKAELFVQQDTKIKQLEESLAGHQYELERLREKLHKISEATNS